MSSSAAPKSNEATESKVAGTCGCDNDLTSAKSEVNLLKLKLATAEEEHASALAAAKSEAEAANKRARDAEEKLAEALAQLGRQRVDSVSQETKLKEKLKEYREKAELLIRAKYELGKILEYVGEAGDAVMDMGGAE